VISLALEKDSRAWPTATASVVGGVALVVGMIEMVAGGSIDSLSVILLCSRATAVSAGPR
jgi:hypothetical protein